MTTPFVVNSVLVDLTCVGYIAVDSYLYLLQCLQNIFLTQKSPFSYPKNFFYLLTVSFVYLEYFFLPSRSSLYSFGLSHSIRSGDFIRLLNIFLLINRLFSLLGIPCVAEHSFRPLEEIRSCNHSTDQKN